MFVSLDASYEEYVCGLVHADHSDHQLLRREPLGGRSAPARATHLC